MREIALIPAYEPDERLIKLLAELREAGLGAVVVDDGSGEAYKDLFGEAGRYADVVSYPENRGKGAALKAGFEYIERMFPEASVVVTADADGQHTPTDVLRVCRLAEGRDGCLVLGCRGFTKGTPLRNRTGNYITRLVFRLATGVSVSDTQTGLRAFGAGLLPYMESIPGERYEYEMNVLMDCAKKHIPIVQTTIETVYIGGNSTSHFDPLRDSFRVYREILRYTASSLASFALDYGLYAALLPALSWLGAETAAAYANILARLGSSAFNYSINKRLVFEAKGRTASTAAEYFILAAAVLALNTLALELFIGLGMNRYLAKIVAGIACSAVSFTAQRFFIFRKKGGEAA